MNGKFVHVADDGTQADVTAGVQALYDLVLASMDWGSGFLSYEDALPVAEIARLAGFEQRDEVERYVREALHSKESAEWQRQQSFPLNYASIRHDHVWSSAGRCMWPCCRVEQPA
jgi:hypothetical protein